MNAADREILDHYARTRAKTLELLELVPDALLARKAEGEGMALGWLFMHIADGPNWWMDHCMDDGLGWRYPGNGPFTRAAIRASLEESVERVAKFFEAEDGARLGRDFALPAEKTEAEGHWTGRNRVLYLTDHEVHHRGKVVLALRQWGLVGFPFMPF